MRVELPSQVLGGPRSSPGVSQPEVGCWMRPGGPTAVCWGDCGAGLRPQGALTQGWVSSSAPLLVLPEGGTDSRGHTGGAGEARRACGCSGLLGTGLQAPPLSARQLRDTQQRALL